MTVGGAAVEEMVVLTARVVLTVALSLAAWMRGQTLLLAAIILRIPESPLTSIMHDIHHHIYELCT